MVTINGRLFVLQTQNTTYIFARDEFDHLRHCYYGGRIEPPFSEDIFIIPPNYPLGTSLVYDEAKNPLLSLHDYPLEIATSSKGDYRSSSLEILTSAEKYLDLKYVKHEIDGDVTLDNDLPTPHGVDTTLRVFTHDTVTGITVILQYGIFFECNIITRNIIIENHGITPVQVTKALSFNLDLVPQNFHLINTAGGWASEAHLQKQKLQSGIYIHDSKAGTSSNRHNPYFILQEESGNLDAGFALGVNLVYSGDYASLIEVNPSSTLRIQTGINPEGFLYPLNQEENLQTPWAVLTVSEEGLNGIRRNFHHFVENHIIPPFFAYKKRPIVFNNWEGTYFNFDEKSLLKMMKAAKKLGAETFVLDDGWFGRRNSDTSGLGDWEVNLKKLPGGLKKLAEQCKKIGLDFGLWVEMEMVNPDSDLYRRHPEWVLGDRSRPLTLGRHQLILDLGKTYVQNFIIETMTKILNSADISYIKWDWNRPMSDLPPRSDCVFAYYRGFYKVMKTLNERFPHVLFEGCASGGNRFDLGILSYFPQIWSSDCTDGYERQAIQDGLLLAYPPSAVSAHVSARINHQTRRRIPLDTRIRVAMTGAYGYELDPSELTPLEEKIIIKANQFYKKHREIFIHGELSAIRTNQGRAYQWLSQDKKEGLIFFFSGLVDLNPAPIKIKTRGLLPGKYQLKAESNHTNIQDFGGLIKMALPKMVKPDGKLIQHLNDTVSAEELMKMDQPQAVILDGAALNQGALAVYPSWSGTGVGPQSYFYSDFGSRLYVIKYLGEKQHD
ncbi:MAG: alpha-galactosidase [Bacilli bacterium]